MRRKRKRRRAIAERPESVIVRSRKRRPASCLKLLLSVAIMIQVLTSPRSLCDSQVKATSSPGEQVPLFEATRLDGARANAARPDNEKQAAAAARLVRGLSSGPLLRTKAGRRVELACHVFGRPLSLSPAGQKWRSAATSGHANDRKSDYADVGAVNATGDQSISSSAAKSKREELLEQEAEEADLVSLIFWYKDDNPTPIYTLDARQVVLAPAASGGQDKKWRASGEENLARNRRLLASARHYPSLDPAARSLRSRIRLEVNDEYPVIKLLLEPAEPRDSGAYKCRVDFRRSRTISQLLRLLVEAPMSELNIRLAAPESESQSESAPAMLEQSTFNENQQLQLTCQALDGSPPPKLDWFVRWPRLEGWSAPEFLSSNGLVEVSPQPETPAEPTTDESNRRLAEASSLTIRNLERRFQGARLGCRASQEQMFAGEPAASSPNYRAQSETGALFGLAVDSTPSPNQDSQGANSSGPQTGAAGIKMIDDSSSRHFIIVTPASGENNEPAGNANRLLIKQTWIDLKLNLKPESVDLEASLAESSGSSSEESPAGKRLLYRDLRGQLRTRDLGEGDKIRLVCSSRGSQPEARLRWRWPPVPLPGRADFRDENKTVQRQTEAGALELELTITRQYHLMELACEATNDHLPLGERGRTLASRLRLHVKFAPVVKLLEARQPRRSKQQLQHSESEDDWRELICQVESNPPINQLVWLLDEQPLARVMSSRSANVVSAPENTSIRGSAGDESPGAEVGAEGQQPGWRPRGEPPGSIETFQPQQLRGADFASKFKITELHKLLVLNLTVLDSKDEYKCRAINSLGEGLSGKLKLSIDYRPICEPSAGQLAGSGGGVGAAAAQAGHVFQVRTSAGAGRILCHSEARPAPTRFAWSFVPLARLTNGIVLANNKLGNVMRPDKSAGPDVELAGKLSGLTTSGLPGDWQREVSAMVTFESETSSNELQLTSELVKFDQPGPPQGLVLCKAWNRLGWQERPCLSLLTGAQEDSHEPSAENCTVRPLLEQTPPPAHWLGPDAAKAAPEVGGRRIAVSVDCSAARDRDKLIFQLAIGRRRDLSGRRASARPRNSPFLQNLTSGGPELEPAGPPEAADQSLEEARFGAGIFSPFSQDLHDDFLERPLLFTQATSARIPIGELFPAADFRPANSSAGEAAELLADGTGNASASSLDRQLDLLNDLVFSIRASNLLSTSKPHAILGSELKLASDEQSERKQLTRAERLNSAASGGQVVQVSRSTSQTREQTEKAPGGESFIEFHQPVSKAPNAGGQQLQQPSIRQQVVTGGARAGAGPSSDLSTSPLDYNINVVAICVGVVLSLFNLALIGVLLRSHKTAESDINTSESFSGNNDNNVYNNGSLLDACAPGVRGALPVQELVLSSTSPLGHFDGPTTSLYHHHQLVGPAQEAFNRDPSAIESPRLGCIVEYAFL